MKSRTKNKAICITVPLYYPHPGGYESYVRRLSEVLCEAGYKVIILTCALSKDAPSKETEKSGAVVIRLDSYLLLKGRFPINKNNAKNHKLFEWIEKQKVDYYIINTRFYSICNKVAEFANSFDIKPILIDHGSAHLTLGNKLLDLIVEQVEHWYTWRLKKYDIAYYGISKASVKWLQHFNIKAKGVLPNSINAKEFCNNASNRDIRKELDIDKNAFIVYFIGRYTKEKGVLQLLEAADKLKGHKDIYFIFCGQGKYKKLINDYAKERNVFDLGIVNTNDVAALMMDSNVMCLPTRSEGFCTSLLEASSCKLASIITHVGGVDELIPNSKYGYVLKNDNPDTIIKAIQYMKNNKKDLKKVSENAYEIVVSEYNWTKTTNKIIEACYSNNE